MIALCLAPVFVCLAGTRREESATSSPECHFTITVCFTGQPFLTFRLHLLSFPPLFSLSVFGTWSTDKDVTLAAVSFVKRKANMYSAPQVGKRVWCDIDFYFFIYLFFSLIWLWSTWKHVRLKPHWWKMGFSRRRPWRGGKPWRGCQEGGIWWLIPR